MKIERIIRSNCSEWDSYIDENEYVSEDNSFFLKEIKEEVKENGWDNK